MRKDNMVSHKIYCSSEYASEVHGKMIYLFIGSLIGTSKLFQWDE